MCGGSQTGPVDNGKSGLPFPIKGSAAQAKRRDEEMINGSYEVFVLVDEACNLMVHDDTVAGFTALDIAACRAMVVEFAQGATEVAVDVPGSVAECIDQAARRAALWDPAQLTTEALRLVLLLSDVSRDLNRS